MLDARLQHTREGLGGPHRGDVSCLGPLHDGVQYASEGVFSMVHGALGGAIVPTSAATPATPATIY